MRDPMAAATLDQSDTALRSTDSLTQRNNIAASCVGADSR